MVLDAAVSIRGVNRSLELCYSSLGFTIPVPSFSSVRLWIQRLGYYKLISPKEKANDWVWIADHTIQLESTKVLFILGIRLQNLPQIGKSLTLADVEPLGLFPVEQSNGEVVFQQLEEIKKKTGTPRCILSDAGSDLKKGAELFCELHPQTDIIYDITHKCACLLKHTLEKDSVWLEFCENVAMARKSLQQTSLSYLLPPVFKRKARYMNLDEIVTWGNRMVISKQYLLDSVNPKEKEKLQQKLGWIDAMKDSLKEWKETMEVIKTTEDFVRKKGIFHHSEKFLQQIPAMTPSSETAKNMSKDLLQFIQLQSLKIQINERLPASTEVIESVFGKLKRIEKDQSKNGFTSMILAIPAMLSKTTQKIIAQAMQEVSAEMPTLWAQKHLGKTTNSKKREFHKQANQTFQIQHQEPEKKGTKIGSVTWLATG